ncbi:MAG: hypothetical protein KTR31_12855 [Myxococcales bacterium]|nr:hypothetical protein [Myxococcales bacterium]
MLTLYYDEIYLLRVGTDLIMSDEGSFLDGPDGEWSSSRPHVRAPLHFPEGPWEGP